MGAALGCNANANIPEGTLSLPAHTQAEHQVTERPSTSLIVFELDLVERPNMWSYLTRDAPMGLGMATVFRPLTEVCFEIFNMMRHMSSSFLFLCV